MVFFCDNNGQLGALTHGFARQWDYTVVASVFWSLAYKGRMSPLLRRVPSASNIADIPSRPFDVDAMRWLQRFAREVPPGDMSPLSRALTRLVGVGFCATTRASHLDTAIKSG